MNVSICIFLHREMLKIFPSHINLEWVTAHDADAWYSHNYVQHEDEQLITILSVVIRTNF